MVFEEGEEPAFEVAADVRSGGDGQEGRARLVVLGDALPCRASLSFVVSRLASASCASRSMSTPIEARSKSVRSIEVTRNPSLTTNSFPGREKRWKRSPGWSWRPVGTATSRVALGFISP